MQSIGIRLGSNHDARNAAYTAHRGPGSDQQRQQRGRQHNAHGAGLWGSVVETTGELVRETVAPVGRAS